MNFDLGTFLIVVVLLIGLLLATLLSPEDAPEVQAAICGILCPATP